MGAEHISSSLRGAEYFSAYRIYRIERTASRNYKNDISLSPMTFPNSKHRPEPRPPTSLASFSFPKISFPKIKARSLIPAIEH